MQLGDKALCALALVLAGCGASSATPPDPAPVAPISPGPVEVEPSGALAEPSVVRDVVSQNPDVGETLFRALRLQADALVSHMSAEHQARLATMHLDISVTEVTASDDSLRVAVSILLFETGPPERALVVLAGAASVGPLRDRDSDLASAAEGALRGAFHRLPDTLEAL